MQEKLLSGAKINLSRTIADFWNHTNVTKSIDKFETKRQFSIFVYGCELGRLCHGGLDVFGS